MSWQAVVRGEGVYEMNSHVEDRIVAVVTVLTHLLISPVCLPDSPSSACPLCDNLSADARGWGAVPGTQCCINTHERGICRTTSRLINCLLSQQSQVGMTTRFRLSYK